MATSHKEEKASLLYCSVCHERLSLDSKTLPCLHSLCVSCLDMYFEGEKENGHCPECGESSEIGRLTLSPIVTKSLRRQHLKMTTEWKCVSCSDDRIESVARNWCHECQKLLCSKCNTFHKKFQPDHKSENIDEMGRDETVALMTTDMCQLHLKIKDCYCKGCNSCLCNTCYKTHSSADSPGCSSLPLSVREEAMKGKSQEGPALIKEMDDFEGFLRNQIEKTKKYTKELYDECNSECLRIFEDFELMKENAIKRRNELCEDLRRVTDEQVAKWSHLLAENEKILKQLEIWRINLKYLLSDSSQDVDIACGLRTLGLKLSSQLENQPSGPGDNKCQLTISFSKWWLQLQKSLKDEKIGSISLAIDKLSTAKSISLEKEWIPQGSNLKWWISSIHVSSEDNHIFICEYWNYRSIMEFTEEGKFVHEYLLDEQMATEKYLRPYDICSISPETLVVVAGKWWAGENEYLIFLERKQISPFLESKNIIETGRKITRYIPRLCVRNGDIIVSDSNLKIDSFTKEGIKIKSIKNAEKGPFDPLIRADPSNRNFWLVKAVNSLFFTSSFEMSYFDEKDEIIHSIKIQEGITDFCPNELGNFFCNWDGIFSFYPEKKSFHKFEAKSERDPMIFVVRNKLYVYLRINGKDLIKIFEIFG